MPSATPVAGAPVAVEKVAPLSFSVIVVLLVPPPDWFRGSNRQTVCVASRVGNQYLCRVIGLPDQAICRQRLPWLPLL